MYNNKKIKTGKKKVLRSSNADDSPKLDKQYIEKGLTCLDQGMRMLDSTHGAIIFGTSAGKDGSE